jgi:hypothetical protein
LAAFEFGSFALTAAGEAIFLELQIAEFFFMLTADVEFDSGFRFSGGVAGRLDASESSPTFAPFRNP